MFNILIAKCDESENNQIKDLSHFFNVHVFSFKVGVLRLNCIRCIQFSLYDTTLQRILYCGNAYLMCIYN